MNISFPENPLYKGLAFIIGGTILLSYATGMTYTVINLLINLLFVVVALGLIYKGFLFAGLDKPITVLYNKVMKKK
jgi:hypothetical protein